MAANVALRFGFYRVSQLCFNYRLRKIYSLYPVEARVSKYASFQKSNQSPKVQVAHDGNIAANSDEIVHPYDRTVFVGKLSPSSTQKLVENYFSQFGVVEKVYLKASKKRYELHSCAFVQFRDASSLERIFRDPCEKHIIDARRIAVKKYKAIDSMKIQVCNVPLELEETQLVDYFSQFGTVNEVQFISNNPLVSRESYCFIKFTSASAAVKALAWPSHHIGQHTVEVKVYTAKEKNYIKGKVVIQSVPEDVTVEALRDYFGKFGSLKFIDFAFYHSKGKQRNCAFLKFSDDETVNLVAGKNGIHFVKDQKVLVKRSSSAHVTEGRDLKIFVDRIPPKVSEKQLRRYFQSFGDATVGKRWKGEDDFLSCIIMFKATAEIDRVMGHHMHVLGGEQLIVKRTGWTAKLHHDQLKKMILLL
ncbi:RNA-binding protein 34-like [Acropora millepora]|uniref:RNA-binding protein 34-like n=1 Tax=Acropora millepora TaxID=45264 RepID=UPI001CF4E9F2|nr:RNA-binding protein 34-like [Acropora millepora]